MSNNSNRKSLSTAALACICLGYVCTINNVTLGAELGTHMTFVNAIITMIVGYVIISAMTVANCMIGTKENATGKEIWCQTFGSAGGRIPSLIVTALMIFAAFFDYWYVGDVFKQFMPNHPGLGFVIGTIVVVLCAAIGSFWGTKSLKWLTRCLIPFAAGLMIVIIGNTIHQAGGMGPIVMTQPTEVFSFAHGLDIFLGGFMICVGLWPDLTMDAKKAKSVAIAVPIGMLMFFGLFLVGMFGAVGVGAYGITPIAVRLGGALFVLTNIFVILAQASTVPSNTHMITTEIVGNFPRVPAAAIIIGEPILAGLASIAIEYGADVSLISSWAGANSILFSPIAGVTIAEYWIVNGGKFRFSLENQPKFRGEALIVALIGVVVGAYFNFFNPILPASLTAFVLAFVLHTILGKRNLSKQPA